MTDKPDITLRQQIEEYERTKQDPRNLGPWKPNKEGNDAFKGAQPITLREHQRKAGQSRSPRKLAALARTREKAFTKAREHGRSPAQLEALAKAREKRWPKEEK